MLYRAMLYLQVAEKLAAEGIDCEVINLRSIKPLDRETIIKSVKKTHRAIVVEEGWPQSGVASEIVTVIQVTRGSCRRNVGCMPVRRWLYAA